MAKVRRIDSDSDEEEEEAEEDDEGSSSSSSEASEDVGEAEDDDEADEVDVPEDEEAVAKKKADDYRANVAALRSGAVRVERAPLVPGILSTDPIAVLKRPFKSPCLNHQDDGGGARAGVHFHCSVLLKQSRRAGAARALILFARGPCGTDMCLCAVSAPADALLGCFYILFAAELRRRMAMRTFFVPWGKSAPDMPKALARPMLPPAELGDDELPPGIEPLVLWEPPGDNSDPKLKPVMVDNMLTKWLRPHQREG